MIDDVEDKDEEDKDISHDPGCLLPAIPIKIE